MSSQVTQGEARFFQRLDQLVSRNDIDLLTFWKTTRLCLTLQEFAQLLKPIQFTISYEELDLLQKDCVQFINLQVLIRNVETWHKKEISVSNFISRQMRAQEQLEKSKVVKRVKDQRSNTLNSFGDIKDNRVRATERQWKKQSKLNQTLIRAKNESDYELTIKVGEANDICKKIKNDCSFIIDSGEGQIKIIELKAKTGQQVELSKKIFEKRYEQLKISSLVREQELQGTLEEDLKKVLVQVMYLSGQLQDQIKLLQAKGVSH